MVDEDKGVRYTCGREEVTAFISIAALGSVSRTSPSLFIIQRSVPPDWRIKLLACNCFHSSLTRQLNTLLHNIYALY